MIGLEEALINFGMKLSTYFYALSIVYGVDGLGLVKWRHALRTEHVSTGVVMHWRIGAVVTTACCRGYAATEGRRNCGVWQVVGVPLRLIWISRGMRCRRGVRLPATRSERR